MKRRPITDFKNLNPAQLIQYAEEIVKKMEAHDVLFVTPIPSLPMVRGVTNDFRIAVADAAFNDRQAISIRNDKRKALEFMIKDLSKYVDSIARGNLTTILRAGFMPSKEPDFSITPNPKAHNVRLEPVGLGTMCIIVKVEPWKKVRYYQFEYRKKGSEADWKRILSTKAVIEVYNLEAFQEYEFRVTYLGRDTEPNYSDIVSTYAL